MELLLNTTYIWVKYVLKTENDEITKQHKSIFMNDLKYQQYDFKLVNSFH
jgi:hypothetical protein